MSFPRFPDSLTEQQFRPLAYRYMYAGKRMDERLSELFRKGQVKGTVTLGLGTEATSVGISLPLRPGRDVVSLLHRDIVAHLVLGAEPYRLFCQYMANAESITHGREGNVHHGDAAKRRFPMMSHLGSMLAPVVGGTWAARQRGEDALGLAIIGDGGTSTGDFHESINLAAVRRVPVLFVVENNYYAFSTPVREQFVCERLSSRAAGYGIEGVTIDGTDAWEVYRAATKAYAQASDSGRPYLLECMCLRLSGHAVYDKGEYVSDEERAAWAVREPVMLARKALVESCGMSEAAIAEIERGVDEDLERAMTAALAVGRPDPVSSPVVSLCKGVTPDIAPFARKNVTNLNAVTLALESILSANPESYIAGLDIAAYGSAFKTCKGLFEKFGPDRVINMPLCESAITGFALGSTQTGARPVIEFQFADFITEAITQLGLNCGTWYFRTDRPVPLVVRLPCGGGVTLGAFHSGEFEGLMSRFPGLKLLYPVSPQEMYEALMAAFHDPNPCIVLENKLLYTRAKGDIDFDGALGKVWRPRRHREGKQVTVVALGSMVETAITAAAETGCDAEVWNPFVLNPLDLAPVAESLRATGRLLVVQEAAETAGIGDRFVSLLCRAAFGALKAAPVVVSAPDTPVPFAPELEAVYRPDAKRVGQAMATLCGA